MPRRHGGRVAGHVTRRGRKKKPAKKAVATIYSQISPGQRTKVRRVPNKGHSKFRQRVFPKTEPGIKVFPRGNESVIKMLRRMKRNYKLRKLKSGELVGEHRPKEQRRGQGRKP